MDKAFADQLCSIAGESLCKALYQKGRNLPWRNMRRSKRRDRMFLASMLVDPSQVAEFVGNKAFDGSGDPNCFFAAHIHALIWENMEQVWLENAQLDLILLAESMIANEQLDEIGGAQYLSGLIEDIV